MRKPKGMPSYPGIYADFDDPKSTDPQKYIYIGGPYYMDHAQIHLSKEQARHLAKWMAKVSAYLEQPKKRKTAKGKR